MTTDTPCELCNGVGLVRGEHGTRPCSCQAQSDLAIRLKNMNIPPEYQMASFETFKETEANSQALFVARRLIANYNPLRKAPDGPTGLLLVGTVGTGKTHLGTAILRLLVRSMGIRGKFVDCRDLYERIKASYDETGPGGILAPILHSDLVLLDELGGVRPSEWVFEVTEHLVGSLYNRQRSIIVTTNFPNLPAGGGNGLERVARLETLGDRIGARMWSRLQQMCVAVQMNGPDWRVRTVVRILFAMSFCVTFSIAHFVLDDVLTPIGG